MTSEQFWEQDCSLVIAYRKAFQIRQERENYNAWLQGMYFFEALCDVAPVLHAFAKSGTRVRPYPDKPYEYKLPEKKTEDTHIEQMRKTADYMNALAARFKQSMNKRPDGKE